MSFPPNQRELGRFGRWCIRGLMPRFMRYFAKRLRTDGKTGDPPRGPPSWWPQKLTPPGPPLGDDGSVARSGGCPADSGASRP
jgi:hypothetical protein